MALCSPQGPKLFSANLEGGSTFHTAFSFTLQEQTIRALEGRASEDPWLGHRHGQGQGFPRQRWILLGGFGREQLPEDVHQRTAVVVPCTGGGGEARAQVRIILREHRVPHREEGSRKGQGGARRIAGRAFEVSMRFLNSLGGLWSFFGEYRRQPAPPMPKELDKISVLGRRGKH